MIVSVLILIILLIVLGIISYHKSASSLDSLRYYFTPKVRGANTNGELIQKYSNQVLKITSECSHLMEPSNDQMMEINRIVENAVVKVEGLDPHSREMSELLSVI